MRHQGGVARGDVLTNMVLRNFWRSSGRYIQYSLPIFLRLREHSDHGSDCKNNCSESSRQFDQPFWTSTIFHGFQRSPIGSAILLAKFEDIYEHHPYHRGQTRSLEAYTLYMYADFPQITVVGQTR